MDVMCMGVSDHDNQLMSSRAHIMNMEGIVKHRLPEDGRVKPRTPIPEPKKKPWPYLISTYEDLAAVPESFFEELEELAPEGTIHRGCRIRELTHDGAFIEIFPRIWVP